MDIAELVNLDPNELDKYSMRKWAMMVRRDLDFTQEDCMEVIYGETTTKEILKRRTQ